MDDTETPYEIAVGKFIKLMHPYIDDLIGLNFVEYAKDYASDLRCVADYGIRQMFPDLWRSSEHCEEVIEQGVLAQMQNFIDKRLAYTE